MDLIENIRSVIRAGADLGDKFNKFNTRSVARGAYEQSFVFQCLMEDTIPVDLATTIAKNLDRLYASWTQIYLSSVGCIDLNYIKNPQQFIAKYQPKFRFENGEDTDDCMEELKNLMYGDSEILMSESVGDYDVVAIISPGGKPPTLEQRRKNSEYFLEGYNVRRPFLTNHSIMTESNIDGGSADAIVDGIIRNSQEMKNLELLKASKDSRGPRITDADVRKVNDMAPYMLELKFLASKGDSAFSQWVNYTIGVKTNLHLGNSNTMVVNLVDVLKNRNRAFNFLRWTTGEISLVKDIILHLDDINFDVANKADRTGKFISSLKRLRQKYVKIGSSGVNRIAPEATIVISSATYQEIKDGYGFDLKNMTFASKILNELFLMSFIILDDVSHTCDILVDGQHDFQTFSLDTLEREVTMNSNKLSKELTRMLGAN